jgi:hypothetical protein
MQSEQTIKADLEKYLLAVKTRIKNLDILKETLEDIVINLENILKEND